MIHPLFYRIQTWMDEEYISLSLQASHHQQIYPSSAATFRYREGGIPTILLKALIKLLIEV